MSMNYNEEQSFKHPEYYEHKANQLRLQNQFLRRQLQSNVPRLQPKQGVRSQNIYSAPRTNVDYTFQHQVPVRQVIYNPVSEPIRPPANFYHQQTSFQAFPQRARTQSYLAPQRQQLYGPSQTVYYNQPYRKTCINEMQQEIIQLQGRGSKLQRQANRLSSYIKEDLRDFIKDSHVNKQCSYKQKFIKAISNRPRYFKFNA